MNALNTAYKADRFWTDLFEHEIKKILADVFLFNEPMADMKQATDLLVLTMKPYTFACRVRRSKYFYDNNGAYRNQFTIRAKRTNGTETEMSKIISGWADYFFYGFSNEGDDGSGFLKYSIIDLKVFRSRLLRCSFEDGHAWKSFVIAKSNKDNSSDFFAFDITRFPANMIVRQS